MKLVKQDWCDNQKVVLNKIKRKCIVLGCGFTITLFAGILNNKESIKEEISESINYVCDYFDEFYNNVDKGHCKYKK